MEHPRLRPFHIVTFVCAYVRLIDGFACLPVRPQQGENTRTAATQVPVVWERDSGIGSRGVCAHRFENKQ